MDRSRPIWKIYLRFFAWILPALAAINFAKIYLLPKMEAIWEKADLGSDDRQALEGLIGFASFFREHPWFLSGSLILAVAIGEFGSRKWPGLRSWVCEIAAYLLFLAALIHYGSIAIWALIVAPMLAIGPS